MGVRSLVEAEEKINYERRMRKSWIEDLSSMTGDKADARLRSQDNGAPQKPYLTEAPIVLAMFKQTHAYDANGKKIDNYYVNESCGIAAGMLIAALHNVGLATLTSTPMGAEQASGKCWDDQTQKNCSCSCRLGIQPRMQPFHIVHPCARIAKSCLACIEMIFELPGGSRVRSGAVRACSTGFSSETLVQTLGQSCMK